MKAWIALPALLMVPYVASVYLGLYYAKVSITVTDEQGQPVSGAKVTYGFDKIMSWGSTKPDPVVNLTDADGHSSGTGKSGGGQLGVEVQKEGYYPSGPIIAPFRESDEALHRWLPWDKHYTVVLKKIGNPVAMYAKHVRTNVPNGKLQGQLGYDLEVGDWVAPGGKGKVSDLIFSWNVQNQGLSSNVQITFSNEFDGLQEVLRTPNQEWGSMLDLPRQAPVTGYQPTWSISYEHSKEKGYYSDTGDKSLFFRVRSVSKNGQLISTLYGKTRGDIVCTPWARGMAIEFIYYLNPDGTTNMEFDPDKDLLMNLQPGEGETYP